MNICVHVASNSLSYVKSCLEMDRECLNRVDINGRPPLYYCLIYPNQRMAELLLSYQPDLFLIDNFGLTVIDYAYYYQQSYFLNLLSKDHINHINRINEVIKKDGEAFLNTLKTQREEDD